MNAIDIRENITRQLPGLVWCKDKNSIFTFANQQVAELLGFNHAEDVCGISDRDYKTSLSELADDFKQEDTRVVEDIEPMKIIFHGNHFSKDPHTWLCEKSPFKDAQGEIVGTLGLALNITQNRKLRNSIVLANEYFMAKDLAKAQFSVSIEDTYSELQATERETSCLFYLMRGKTAKGIAKILDISPKTVESHIERLRVKANCQNKSELIDKCITRGLINILPRHLFQSVPKYP